MAGVAEEPLADLAIDPKAGLTRFIRHQRFGVVSFVAPWNYPYLTAVNAVAPAILAGNAVILKHSHQTPLCAERFAEAFAAAGVPDGVFLFFPLFHEDALAIISPADADYLGSTSPRVQPH